MRLLLELGPHYLDVTVKDETDLDSRFEAVCNETGETLMVNGWMIDEIEKVAPD